MLGFAKREGPALVFRNPLYAEFVRSSQQLRPEAVVEATAPLVVEMSPDRLSFLPESAYRTFADESQRGAAKAFEAGSYRLTLVARTADGPAIAVPAIGEGRFVHCITWHMPKEGGARIRTA